MNDLECSRRQGHSSARKLHKMCSCALCKQCTRCVWRNQASRQVPGGVGRKLKQGRAGAASLMVLPPGLLRVPCRKGGVGRRDGTVGESDVSDYNHRACAKALGQDCA